MWWDEQPAESDNYEHIASIYASTMMLKPSARGPLAVLSRVAFGMYPSRRRSSWDELDATSACALSTIVVPGVGITSSTGRSAGLRDGGDEQRRMGVGNIGYVSCSPTGSSLCDMYRRGYALTLFSCGRGISSAIIAVDVRAEVGCPGSCLCTSDCVTILGKAG